MNRWLLGTALVAYNNVTNRWKPFSGPMYVPLNVAVSAGLTTAALGVWNLDREDIGLGPGQGRGLAAGVAGGAIGALPLFLALAGRRTAVLVADRRLAGMDSRELAYRTIIRVPFGTALPEELIFRGVLLAVMAEGDLEASLWSSLAFGLWHVGPAYNRLQENGRVKEGAPAALVASIAGSVALTGLAGLLFCRLRIETGGVAAPFALHATLNSLGTVAAHLANRKTGRPAIAGGSAP